MNQGYEAQDHEAQERDQQAPIRVLVLGAAYGLLPGVKLGLAGHAVTFVGRPDEIAAMRQHDLELSLPLRRQGGAIALRLPVGAASAPGIAALTTPEAVEPQAYDFVILAMQEPQYRAPEVARLMARIAAAGLPCLSIMNLPPRPFLERFGTIDPAAYDGVYSSAEVWSAFDPTKLSLTSPDAQALRLDPERPGRLTVTLASNFKAAPFAVAGDQQMLERLAKDMAQVKVTTAQGEQRAPVLLLAQRSLFSPLAKWPMLLAGNCRCFASGKVSTIAETVLGDLAASAAIYEHVLLLLRAMGADPGSMVDFASYSKAAAGLTRPSSLARGLAAGAVAVERIDRLVLNLLQLHGLDTAPVEPIVATIDRQLAANAAAAA